MNPTEAINKIIDLLSPKLKSEKFMVTKLVDDTEITNNKDGEDSLQIGDELYIVKESVLQPAPSGIHETREGLLISVGEDSVIYKMEKKMEETDSIVDESITDIEDEKEDMMKKEKMTSAILADGTKIETDGEGEFQVGEKLYVITEEGERVDAPEGEHTTESGIVLTVDSESVITGVKYPDEEGEGSMEDMKKMKETMSSLLSMMKELQTVTSEFKKMKEEFESFKKSPDRDPVLKKFSSNKSDLLDWKLELIKNSKR
jgi:prefoldin subunit 5